MIVSSKLTDWGKAPIATAAELNDIRLCCLGALVAAVGSLHLLLTVVLTLTLILVMPYLCVLVNAINRVNCYVILLLGLAVWVYVVCSGR